MDHVNNFQFPDPKYGINSFKKLTYWWIRPFLRRLKYNRFELEDLYNIDFQDRTENLSAKLEESWKNEFRTRKRRTNLIKALKRVFGRKFYIHGLFIFVFDVVMKPIHPIIISSLVTHYSSTSTASNENPYVLTSILLVLMVMERVCLSKERLDREENGIRVFAACSSLVHKKMIRLQCTEYLEDTRSAALNTMEKYHNAFELFFSYGHYLWATPLTIIYVTVILYMNIGVSAVFGVAVVLLQSVFGLPETTISINNKYSHKLYCRASAWARERVDLITETIRKFYTMKINCWERPLKQRVERTRRREMKCLREDAYMNGVSLTCCDIGQRISLLFTFFIYATFGHELEVHQIYMVILSYFIVYDSLILLFPKAWYSYKDAYKFAKYIERFLCQKEFSPNSTNLITNIHAHVSIANVNVAWSQKADILRDINFEIPAGQFHAVMGYRNVGKTSLLKLILGELQPNDFNYNERTRGMRKRNPQPVVKVNGRISYATQEPWLFTGTLKNNIIFGQVENPLRYEKVKEICQLDAEFELLPKNEYTFFENHKMVLSPELRAKIHLARALYQDANIYLLDDSFFLLDEEIFHNCVNVFLKDKIRVVTMNVVRADDLKQADRILYLKGGRIVFEGSYKNYKDYDIPKPSKTEMKLSTRKSNLCEPPELPIDFNNIDSIFDENIVEDTREILSNRRSALNYYWDYLMIGSHEVQLIALVLQFICAQVAIIQTDYWLAYWAVEDQTHRKNVARGFDSEWNLKNTLFTYGTYIGAMMIGSFLMRNIIFLRICAHAGDIIHRMMFDRLMGSTLRIFSKNSAEKIISQFKKDVLALDDYLPKVTLEVLRILFSVFGSVALLIGLNYWMILPIIFLGVCYYEFYKLYIRTVPKIMGMEDSVRKTVRTEVEASFPGAYMICCVGWEAHEVVHKTYYAKQDVNTSTKSLLISSMAALDFWLQSVSTLYCIVVIFGLLTQGSLGEAYFGAMLLQMFLICREAKLGLEPFAASVALKTNLKRALYKYKALEQEQPITMAKGLLPDNWPPKGQITFELSSVRFYDEKEPALKRFNLVIPAGSKVLIKQHAPANRSPIVAALCRVADVDGRVTIDGIDTKRLALSKLRNSISIVSEESTFFTSILKESLDPMRTLPDELLLDALGAVHFRDYFPSLNVSLEGLSASKRKRISLARAVAHRRKIIVIEGTFEDPTDYKIHEALHRVVNRKFRDSTVLVIRNLLTDHPPEDLTFDIVITLNADGMLIDYPEREAESSHENNGSFDREYKEGGDPPKASYLFKQGHAV